MSNKEIAQQIQDLLKQWDGKTGSVIFAATPSDDELYSGNIQQMKFLLDGSLIMGSLLSDFLEESLKKKRDRDLPEPWANVKQMMINKIGSNLKK